MPVRIATSENNEMSNFMARRFYELVNPHIRCPIGTCCGMNLPQIGCVI